MGVPKLSDIEAQPAIRFSPGNSIKYWMDFSYWAGIPSDRNFYIESEQTNHDCYYLVARGYGVAGDYGNGSIMVKKADVVSALCPAVFAFESAKDSLP